MLEREPQARLEVERQKQQPAPAFTIPQPTQLPPAPIAQEDACKRDDERLARLRTSPARDEVIRFERELGCERLRPQVVRLRESISAEGEHGQRESAQRSEAEQPRPTADLGLQKPQRDGLARVASPPIPQEQICQRDQERLTLLRASPVRDEVVRFEHELGCERLRPQVVRLRESISGEGKRGDRETAQSPRIEQQRPTADAELQKPERDAAVHGAPSLIQLEQICKRDYERLTRLRASPERDEVARFERELGCERLRPQVVRLRESLGAN
jgi:hypothetical protein